MLKISSSIKVLNDEYFVSNLNDNVQNSWKWIGQSKLVDQSTLVFYGYIYIGAFFEINFLAFETFQDYEFYQSLIHAKGIHHISAQKIIKTASFEQWKNNFDYYKNQLTSNLAKKLSNILNIKIKQNFTEEESSLIKSLLDLGYEEKIIFKIFNKEKAFISNNNNNLSNKVSYLIKKYYEEISANI